MKWFIAVLFVTLPAAAQAMGMGMEGGCDGAGKGMMLIATALYAAVAALGYWVLQHADKDTRGLVKRTGKVIAWILIVLGLLGFLCGVGAHVMKAVSKCGGKCPSEMMEGGHGGGQQGQSMQMEHMGKAKTK